MKLSRVRRHLLRLAFPVILGLAILFGGSSLTGLSSRMWLSVAALIMLLAAIPIAAGRSWNRPALLGLGLFAAWSFWTLLQQVPLPHYIWQHLGDRSAVSDGLELMDLPATKAMPISLAPSESFLSLFGTLPPLAIFVLFVALGWRFAAARLNWAIPLFGAAGALLGLAQILVGDSDYLYFYEVTARGLPVGVFANPNHQACFLLMCLPFVAALIGQLRRDWASGDSDHAKAIVITALAGLILVGILAAGSVAGYALLLPVLVLSVLLARKPRSSGRPPIASPAIVIVSTLAAVLLVAFSPVLDGLGVTSFENSDLSRLGIWNVTGEIAENHWLAGTGLGSFEDVYRLYENPDTVTEKFVNHAHNDYLQAIVEFGLPGTVILLAGVVLILVLFVRVWTRQGDEHRRLRRAAATALLVLILHSFVDYPGRRPAIACLAATCFALLVVNGDSERQRRSKATKRPDIASPTDDRRLVI